MPRLKIVLEYIDIPDRAELEFNKGVLLVNGDPITTVPTLMNGHTPNLHITLFGESFVNNLHSDGDISCREVYGNVSAGVSVSSGAITGNVTVGRNINCDYIIGDVNTQGITVSCIEKG